MYNYNYYVSLLSQISSDDVLWAFGDFLMRLLKPAFTQGLEDHPTVFKRP